MLNAAEGGVKLKPKSPASVVQYVFAVLGMASRLIAIVGSSVNALCNLLGTVVFSEIEEGNPADMIGDALRTRIERLIDTKLDENELKILISKIADFKLDLELYNLFLNDYHAATGAEKESEAQTVHATHIAYLSVLLAGIPEFQIESIAVPSLPPFSHVATLHLTLLADGIKLDKDWGLCRPEYRDYEAFV